MESPHLEFTTAIMNLWLFGLACLLIAIWLIPKWQCRKFRKLGQEIVFDKENESRKTLAQILGGMLVILSLFATEQTFKLSQEGQTSDRYARAISLLGDAKPEIRLGGIFALDRLARQSTEDDSPIIDVLAGYVRTYAPWPPSSEKRRDQDIITILRIIGRRSATQRLREQNILNFAETDLRGLVLDDLDLSGMNFTDAHLERSTLRHTRLKGSFLVGCHLENALVGSPDIDQVQIDGACGNAATVLPPSIKKPSGWLKTPPVCTTVEQ